MQFGRSIISIMYSASWYTYHLCKINTIGSSGDVFPNLSAGAHSMNVRFTPAGSCDSFALQPAINFTIVEPTPAPTTGPSKITNIVAARIWQVIWHPIVTVSISGSVSVDGNTATITLNSNVDGVFQCSLDGGAFANCMVFILCIPLLSYPFVQRWIRRYIHWIIRWCTYHECPIYSWWIISNVKPSAIEIFNW